jgi:chromate reductase
MSVLKILVIPGSIRAGSVNVRLAAAITRELAASHVDVTRISLADHALPLYDGDVELKSGAPREAVNLKRLIGLQHGVAFVGPEYNASVAPLLKNAIDWISRVRERGEERGSVFRNRVFAIASASNRSSGGLHGLDALRQALTLGCGAQVIPAQLAVANADQAFGELDELKDSKDAEKLRLMAAQLIDIAQRMM